LNLQILDALRMPWPTDWLSIFDTAQSPIIEVGFGNARYLAHLATSNPKSNIIGLEISNHGLDYAASRLDRSAINNTRLIRARAYMFFWLVCPSASVKSIHINFPDPWPKAGHSERRLVNEKFLKLLSARIERGGLINIATDDEDYALSMTSNFLESRYFEEASASQNRQKARVRTKYELKAITDGRQCHYLCWRRNELANQDEIPRLEELDMPHAVVSTPLSLMEIGHIFGPVTHQVGSITVRFIDFFQSLHFDQAVVDTYVAEGELEQRVMMMIKRRGDDRYLISLKETGFPRPTPATHLATRYLAELVVSMHAKAKIVNHNLRPIESIQ
jgi:tRNA (guanine-N7-)-methyltransferase